jgi:Protein of unknown function (DUF3147)
MWIELLLRALVGGTIVSAFALVGDVLQPKSFAGLFGAAPSVAIASLALTFHSRGTQYAATEAQWMIAGAVAFAAYACVVCRLLLHGRCSVGGVAMIALIAWFAVAFGLWGIVHGANLG